MNLSPLFVVGAVLRAQDNRFLLSQRPLGKAYAGQWEFPGGKVAPGELPEEALVRELAEELGITVLIQHLIPWTFVTHRYAEYDVILLLYTCATWEGIPAGQEGQAVQWVTAAEAARLPVLEADRPLLVRLGKSTGLQE
ncbi:MAG: (deoxy)nucleoside triphosphate pyrophosphohydrolase [Holosporales bacterium]